MKQKETTQNFKNFKNLPEKSRQIFLGNFEKKMLYRTTKTENPETTIKMVEKVLNEKHR